jgi:hypothetical protein
MKMKDRDLVEREGVFELFKKKNTNKKNLQRYHELLD